MMSTLLIGEIHRNYFFQLKTVEENIALTMKKAWELDRELEKINQRLDLAIRNAIRLSYPDTLMPSKSMETTLNLHDAAKRLSIASKELEYLDKKLPSAMFYSVHSNLRCLRISLVKYKGKVCLLITKLKIIP